MKQFKLELAMFETMATASLEGRLLMSNILPLQTNEELELIFPNSSIEYCRNHNGPRSVVVNDFTFGCLAESLVNLMVLYPNRIKISTYED